MKFNQILCAVLFLIVLHLTVFVSASTIQRSLSDDIRSGISIAGKILGIDSPTNIAVVSNVAELVTRAFSKNSNKNQQNGWDRRQMTERYPSEHLEDFGEAPPNFHQTNSNEQGNIDDNVIVSSNINPNPTTTTSTAIDYGFMSQVLRVMGMDTSKIGSIAINGIIFIAQMIGRSFMSAFTTMTNRMSAKPNQNIDITERNRRLSDDDDNDESGSSFWDNTLAWILERSRSNEFLSQQVDTMLDRSLPERLVNMVDNGNDDETSTNEQTDCIKQLLCKTAPFIWGMQKAVTAQMNNSNAETTAADDSKDEKNARDDEDERTNVFFKFLPTVDEFKDNGITCEDLYKQCKLF